jgi:hypothetical protein
MVLTQGDYYLCSIRSVRWRLTERVGDHISERGFDRVDTRI